MRWPATEVNTMSHCTFCTVYAKSQHAGAPGTLEFLRLAPPRESARLASLATLGFSATFRTRTAEGMATGSIGRPMRGG